MAVSYTHLDVYKRQPQLAGVFFLLLFSFMAWMACKMARPLFNLLDLIIKGNLAVDKVRHGIKADDIAREVIQEVPTNQG